MTELIKPLAEICAALTEAIGVLLITAVSLLALGKAGSQRLRSVPSQRVFQEGRERLARGILLGLEFLVAADIINTVALELTFQSVGVLAVIVLIRTFLSFALHVELHGRWPWQEAAAAGEA